jgi:ectoine hydroxylase-related dioxygenase (phytanoyl-CoA dioxygenase family)
VLGADAFPVDALFFDKQEDANWAVPAHQDRQMPVATSSPGKVRARHGISYAEPQTETLAALLALRLHFDTTTAQSGALCLVPGSHRRGVLSSDDVLTVPPEQCVVCEASAGDVLMMRPLTLHRSASLVGSGQRRVLHVVYATAQPPDGLMWRTLP